MAVGAQRLQIFDLCVTATSTLAKRLVMMYFDKLGHDETILSLEVEATN